MGDLGLLRSRLEELDRVVVAFSGGADSAFLAWVANDVLGPARNEPGNGLTRLPGRAVQGNVVRRGVLHLIAMQTCRDW